MTSRFKKSNGSGFDTKRFPIAQLKETETADGGVLFKGLWGDTQLFLEQSSDPPDAHYQNCKALWDFYFERDGVRFRLTQIWECESRSRETYFSGYLAKARLTLVSRKGEDDSTWDLFLEEGKKEAEEQEGIRNRAAGKPAASPSQKPSIALELDDEVPF